MQFLNQQLIQATKFDCLVFRLHFISCIILIIQMKYWDFEMLLEIFTFIRKSLLVI